MNPSNALRFLAAAAALSSLVLCGCNKYEAGACAQTAAKPATADLAADTVVATWGAGEKLTAGDLEK